MIDLDNAATSFPKPPEVSEAIADLLTHRAGNPGRSGHALAVAAQAAVADTRRLLASFLGARDPSRLVFALNATDALNTALLGPAPPGLSRRDDERRAQRRGPAALRARRAGRRGRARALRVPTARSTSRTSARALEAGPTRLVAMTHASNVCGTILPVREAARLAHRHGAFFLVDAAQTAGVLPIDVTEMGD